MNAKKSIIIRAGILYAVFVLVGLVISYKVLVIQIVEGPEWREKTREMTEVLKTIEAGRGSILAADGSFLAISVPEFELRFDPLASGITDKIFSEKIDSLALCMQNTFGRYSHLEWKARMVNARKNKNSYFLLIPKADYGQAMAAKKFPIFNMGRIKGGLILEEKSRREKPLSEYAKRTIGRPDTKDAPGMGLEQALDSVLKGRAGLRLMTKLSGDVWRPAESTNTVDPIDGLDILSTIDPQIQEVAHEELARQLRKNQAHHGCVIVMETATGNINAMANLTRTETGEYIEDYNYAIGEKTEPGSTIKLLTMLALLEDGYVSPGDSVSTDNGEFRIYSHKITDSRLGGYGTITYKQAFEYSSNVAMAKGVNNAYRSRPEAYIKHFERVGLTRKTGIEIAGEPEPYIKSTSDSTWSGLSLSMMSIGYEMLLTPLQILTFYNAIANKGYRVEPRLVSEWKSRGRTVKTLPIKKDKTQICSQNTLAQLQEMLNGVVENGTATNLKDHAIAIAGKTGTAKISRGKEGYIKEYRASFCGFFPAQDPKYSCIVVVSNPAQEGYYGNVVAGPIFRAIADQVYASRFDINKNHYGSPDINMSDRILSVKGGYTPSLWAAANALGMNPLWKSEFEWIEPTKINNERPVELINTGKHVPKVIGLGAKDAIHVIQLAGMYPNVRGRGSVKYQSIPPGSTIPENKKISLILEP